MNKNYLYATAGVLLSAMLPAQNDKYCGYTHAMNAVYATHPELKTLHEQADNELDIMDQQSFTEGYKFGYHVNPGKGTPGQYTSGVNGTVYTIPIVFHILHQNGSEKIDESQIIDQVKILNRDYRKMNADTSVALAIFKPIIGDVEIEFRLATIDPNGNCTNGIIYHQDSRTAWDNTDYSYYAFSGTGSGQWDPRKYLNVYVVKSISSGAAGYTYKPGTWSAGAAQDAIVILHDYVGSIGTSVVGHSRALTHEVGHWFNLAHTWGNTNQPGVSCSGTDNVNDTPTTKGFTSCPAASTPSQYQICTSGVSENYQNYMDYSYCSVMFTQGQVTRMRTAATSTTSGRNQLWSVSNLAATGVSNPQVCVPVADFNSNKTSVCTGQTIQYSDNSMNAHPTSWNWSFTGGSPASSADSMPVITYNTPGQYAVSYTATTTAGSGNITKTMYINVLSSTAAYQTQFSEGFENGNIPNADWSINNPGGVTWTRVNSTAATGTYSMKIDNTANTARSYDELISPTFNIQNMNSIGTGFAFTFKVAHQQSSSAQKDRLQVLSSTNCGQTWATRYSKTGATLATVNTVSTSAFTPTSTQWRTETVNCSALLSSPNVMFKFVFTCDTLGAGNNVYVDDINIASSIGIEENDMENLLDFQVYPNPSSGTVNISFNLNTKHHVQLSVCDMLGKVVEAPVNSTLNTGSYQYLIGANNKLSSGIYFLNLNIDGKMFSRKLVVE